MNPELKKVLGRPMYFYDSTRLWAADRDRLPDGTLPCSHCEQPITDQQVVSLNHRNQWRSVKSKLISDPDFLRLGPRAQRQRLKDRYNDVNNVEPVHEACHREIDQGIILSPEEAGILNLKPSLRPTNANTSPEHSSITGITRFGKMRVSSHEEVLKQFANDDQLLAIELLSPEQEAKLLQAPRIVQYDYLGLCYDRLHEARAQKRDADPNISDRAHENYASLRAQISRLEEVIGPNPASSGRTR